MNVRPSARWWLLLAFALASGAASSDSRETELRWIRQHLPPVPEWTEWQQRTGALPPDFCALPRRNRLPDPLRFEDGREVATPAEWVERRREILRLFERDVTGRFPPQPPLDGVTLLQEVRGEGYRTRDVRLQFGGDRAAGVRVRVTRPDGPGPFPTLVAPGLASAWPPRLIRRGYVSVGYAGSDRDDDAAALSQHYPEHDFALLARRAWLVPVVMDYLETLPEVNSRQVALFGYSRDGKMAALATALEPRVAALIAGSTGVGGFLPWRHAGERGGGESIESTTRMFPAWFAPQLRFFAGREDRLPVDGNLLTGLERYYRDRALLPRLGLIAAGGVPLPYDYEDLLAEIPARMLVVQPRRDRDADGASVRAAVGEAQRRRPGGASTLELDEPDDYARLTSATQTRVIEWMCRNLSAPAP